MPEADRRRAGRITAPIVAATTLLLTLGNAATAPQAQAEAIRPKQWYLNGMHAQEMWQTTTGKGITVAVIDTGVDASHPDLRGQVLAGAEVGSGPGSAVSDTDGHGTAMASLIAGTGRGDGGQGVSGLAPGARILPIKVDQDSTAGNEAASATQFDAELAQAIHYAVDSGAQIINISMGSSIDTPALDSAVRYAVAKGSLIFSSVGNSGSSGNSAEYPGANQGVVGVSAVDEHGAPTSESQHGAQVALAAPGANIVQACTGGSGYCNGHGTSASSALASASAALIWSAHRGWTANQVLRIMLNTAGGPTDGAKRNDYIGYGVVRPRVALANPGDPGPADVNPLFPQLSKKSRSSATSQTGGAPVTPSGRSSAATASDSATGITLWGGIVIAAAVAIGGVAVFVRVRRKSTTTGSGEWH